MKQKIDEQGNPVLDEKGEPVMVNEEPEVTPVSTEEELEKVKAENATLLQTKETLVTEIQEERKKKQTEKEEKETLANKVAELEGGEKDIEPKETDVLKKVAEMLNKNKQETVSKSKDKAMEKFLAKHPELAPANDEAGLKKAAFDRKLGMFNTNTLEDESEFLSVFEDTYKLLGNTENVVDETTEIVTTPGSNKLPHSDDINKLTPKELKFVNDNFKGDVKRYLELKTKYPETIPKF